ncbi:RRM_2 domain-containing protein [Cephalotus follicularis]|uniref:RRM_2 domain-containing protein n=1 Tax=Cephalotus follicularis TaxID=3775 RepID=A0A1Q3C7Z7_CEPFO|nr:RRM_2 domain-containing protein [Cephalotus follicularis]
MCLTPLMASPLLIQHPKPLNPQAESFTPKETSLVLLKNEPVLSKKLLCLPNELYAQLPPQAQVLPWPMIPDEITYYPREIYALGQVWCPTQHVVCYNTFQQPTQVIFPCYGSRGNNESGTENIVEEVKGCVEVSDGKRKVNNGLRRVVGVGPIATRSNGGDAFHGGERNSCWVPRRGCSKDHQGASTKKTSEDTTVMIRNIPNQFRRDNLVRILDRHCCIENSKADFRSDPCRSAYDLVYLPMDFGFHANLGYAFVNFTNAVGASRFCKFFDKYEWKVPENRKICEVSWAKYQGKDALMGHLGQMRFLCHTNAYLPVVFSPPRNGVVQTPPTFLGTRVHLRNRKTEKLMIRRRRKNL